MKAFNWSDVPLRIIYIKGNRFHLHGMHAVWLKKRKNRNLEGYILLQVSPVINHCPRNNPQMNGDVILLAVVHVNLWFLTKNRRQPLDEVRVRLEAFVFYSLRTGDVWKWASIIGSQTPSGHNGRIYRPWHFSWPWTCYLRICRSIAGWNTTRLHVWMIPQKPHISAPVKSRKYLKGSQVKACPALHHAVSGGALKNPAAFFVYKSLIVLMPPRSPYLPSLNRSHRQRPKHSDELRICACARLEGMREMWDSTFKLSFISRGQQRKSVALSSLAACSLHVCVCKHTDYAHIHKEACTLE